MDRVVKVFAGGAERKELSRKYEVIEPYDAFLLLRVPAGEAKALARRHLTEDITDLYPVRVSSKVIQTSPRARRGAARGRAAAPAAKSLGPGPHHYLVEFKGPIKDEWLASVKRAGGQIRVPYQNFTYVVRADDRALEKISALPAVRWAGHLPHWARIASAIREKPKKTAAAVELPRTRVLPGMYVVEFFGAGDLKKALPKISRLKLKVQDKDAKGKVLIVEAHGSEAEQQKQLEALSAVHGVRSIRARTLKRTTNDVAAGILETSRSLGSPGLGLSGKGETVAVCDTGIDTGDADSIHDDFAGRVAAIRSYPITSDFDDFIDNPGGNDGPADLDSGHGTHVAGSVLGNGKGSDKIQGLQAPIRGLAYRARLVFQAVEQEMEWTDPDDFETSGRYVLSGIPHDLTDIFRYAYNRGARIHSNSWGGGDPGAYDSQCEQLDRFVWDHKNFCILFSAGNDGTDRDGDGKINRMSVTSPGTSKNCITVGASENRRPAFNAEKYGEWWPGDFPVSPFAGAPMADRPNQVVAFSSRGPTLDGRIKPDVVAPGTFILSTRSSQIALNNTAWAPFPPSRLYFHMGGTSMATPLVAGAAAVVREYLRKKAGIANPSAALIKAALIAGARRLTGTAPAGTLGDNHQGFGRVNLDAVLALPSPVKALFRDVKPGLNTGGARTVDVQVLSSKAPLKVVLAYSDFPGRSLVNNLNLIVESPTGKTFAGNQTPGAPPALDRKNNVEVVRIAKPKAGTWKVRVVASSVPEGPQDYALVILGRF
jgi:subtilisin family serine protease